MGKKVNTFLNMLLEAGFNIPVDLMQEKQDYIAVVGDMDFQQATGRYVWEDLPEGMTSHLIETMLYCRGSLAGFFDGGKLKILPYANQGSINEYGIPTDIKPLTFNGTSAEENKPYGAGKIYPVSSSINIKEEGAVLLFERTPLFRSGFITPRMIINSALISLEAEIISRIKNNIKNSDNKIIFYADDENQKATFEAAIKESYTADSPFIVLVKGSQRFGKDNTDYFHGEVGLKAQELFESWQSVNNIRVMALGIPNGGAFEKKERVVTGELVDETVQTNIVADSGLTLRKLFIEELKLTYPQYGEKISKIKVRLVSDDISKEKEDKVENENERQTNEKEEEEE